MRFVNGINRIPHMTYENRKEAKFICSGIGHLEKNANTQSNIVFCEMLSYGFNFIGSFIKKLNFFSIKKKLDSPRPQPGTRVITQLNTARPNDAHQQMPLSTTAQGCLIFLCFDLD